MNSKALQLIVIPVVVRAFSIWVFPIDIDFFAYFEGSNGPYVID
jgi:hypothetical protein